jgi:hypothetical protein
MTDIKILPVIDDDFAELALQLWMTHPRDLDAYDLPAKKDCPGGVRAAYYAETMRVLFAHKLADVMKESTIAWTVCASIHREYGKGKDPLFTTRQGDFTRHEETCRAEYNRLLKLIEDSPV